MMRIFTLFFVGFCALTSSLTAQSSLEGKVTEQESGEPVIFGTVSLYKNNVLITGTETDFDGNYAFSNIDPGTYDVEASYVGFTAQRQTGVLVPASKTVRLDFELSSGVVLEDVEIIGYKVPLIEQDNTTTGGIKTAEQIRNLPTKDINALAATTAGLSSIDGGDISIRGSRTNATDYYVDGIRVSGNLIPQSEIEQLQVITGGIEAQYGDVTGGIISLTTKGPSQQFSGGLEVESSELLDAYGYNLISANLSGPILKSSKGNSILGFRVSGQLLDQKDDNPRAYGFYRAKDSVIESLSEDPLQRRQGTLFSVAETLTDDDVVLEKAAPNEQRTGIDFTGKIDARLSDAVDMSISGSYNEVQDRFGQGRAWGLLNWENNPIDNTNIYRINARIRHRIGGRASASVDDAAARASLIRNASYALQFGYQRGTGETQDFTHRDNFFDYGYVGMFDNTWVPSAGESMWSGGKIITTPSGFVNIAHSGYTQQFNGWTPGTVNSAYANYNKLQEDVPAMNQFNAFNSFLSSSYNVTWGGLHNNVGGIYNRYNRNEGERYTVNVTSNFDLLPGGSDKGRHSIQFGIIYEQRIGRSWTINPYRLWEIARSQANAHILGVDTNNIIGTFFDSTYMMEFEQFQTLINNGVIQDADVQFFKKIREITGQSVYDYVNVDGISPDKLSLDLFSPQELNDQRIIDYYGYDYLGNPISNSATFEDFFTDVDENGQRQFTVAPNKPIYQAAYIQDKFTFKDIIFRLGLRVDRYDANTKVLKDPYTLYEIMSADDFYAGPGSGEFTPPNVESDWKVYVEGPGSTNVKAYRDGEQWYNSSGSPVNSGNAIFAGQLVHPYYVEQDIEKRNIRSRDFDPNTIFEDYTPQVNWMPRLAFSFPISEEANFFMHYDILVQRPPSNNLATALDYYYFEDAQPRNNPNLKPEQTIDWEAGFKQKLSNSSAMTISAYVKELRNMIQSRYLVNLPPPINQYETIGNIDFGTVKGFSLSYDLRRTNNLEMTASYTLQFADGTGSTVDSQRDIARNGNLRQLIPLSYDERHRFVANLDYRYASGKAYNGPRWFGADIFSNAGVNLQVATVSGRPYTRQQNPTRFGGTGFNGAINGARYPWNVTVDLRVNKQFRLSASQDKQKQLYCDVYFRVQNLLDTRNVIGVYGASGSAEDPGYLASSFGLDELRTLEDSGRDVDAFLTSYQWLLLNPGFYTLPRRMYLGAIVQF